MTQQSGTPTEERVLALMAQHGGDAAAAKALGIHRATFHRWRRKYGLTYGRVPVKEAA
jgi:transcriptional regulator of acetoin/glycerol metabolism